MREELLYLERVVLHILPKSAGHLSSAAPVPTSQVSKKMWVTQRRRERADNTGNSTTYYVW